MEQKESGIRNDTIIALATAYGVGAIAVIRLSTSRSYYFSMPAAASRLACHLRWKTDSVAGWNG